MVTDHFQIEIVKSNSIMIIASLKDNTFWTVLKVQTWKPIIKELILNWLKTFWKISCSRITYRGKAVHNMSFSPSHCRKKVANVSKRRQLFRRRPSGDLELLSVTTSIPWDGCTDRPSDQWVFFYFALMFFPLIFWLRF